MVSLNREMRDAETGALAHGAKRAFEHSEAPPASEIPHVAAYAQRDVYRVALAHVRPRAMRHSRSRPVRLSTGSAAAAAPLIGNLNSERELAYARAHLDWADIIRGL